MKAFVVYVIFICVWGVAQQKNTSIIFVSDTQAPLWIETLRLNEHGNEKATEIIYDAIEKESTAVGIFHLGDITSVGMMSSYWAPFDHFQKHLRIPVYPAIGNHDYFFYSPYALEEFRLRFPLTYSTWYTVVLPSVAVIVLNSNFSQLSAQEQTEQSAWYRNELWTFEHDSTISSIIVVCHHSPYTNSEIVLPSIEVQLQFVTPFLMYKKTSVFLSGHAHAYEHFQHGGKEFLVIGGGGGLLHPLWTDSLQRYHDLFNQQSPLRFFHYVECEINNSALQFNIKKLRNDFSGFDSVDSLTVSFIQ